MDNPLKPSKKIAKMINKNKYKSLVKAVNFLDRKKEDLKKKKYEEVMKYINRGQAGVRNIKRDVYYYLD